MFSLEYNHKLLIICESADAQGLRVTIANEDQQRVMSCFIPKDLTIRLYRFLDEYTEWVGPLKREEEDAEDNPKE